MKLWGYKTKCPKKKCIKSEKFNNLKNIFEVKKEKGDIPCENPRKSPLSKNGEGARKRGKKSVLVRDRNQPRIFDLWERKKKESDGLSDKD